MLCKSERCQKATVCENAMQKRSCHNQQYARMLCKSERCQKALTFESTKFLDGDYPQYPDEFCTLSGGNLFPTEYFPIFRRKTPAMIRAYTAITPALYLLSKIIREKSQTWAIFVRRKILGSCNAARQGCTWPGSQATAP